MLSNEMQPGCAGCHRMESIGNRSLRMELNEAYGRPTSPSLRYMEFNLGNLCNFKCRMCDSRSSSRWAADEIALGLNPRPLRRWNLGNVDADLSTVDRIKFKGGEPCLEQDTMVSILERIHEHRGKLHGLQVNITTNGSKIFNERLMNLLSECGMVNLNISIDGMGAVNDYQRTGSVWEEISSNLKTYHDTCGGNFVLQTTTTWTLLNVNGSVEFMSWVHGNLPRFAVYGSAIETPGYLCISNIGPDMKSKMMDRLIAWDALDHIDWVMHNKRIILSELSRGPVVPPSDALGMISRLDALRDEDFSMIEPDVYASLASS